MLSCLKLARKTTKDRRVGSSLLTRLFTAKAPTFFPALTERAGDFRSTFLPPKLPFATAAPLTVACRAGDFRSTFLPRELQRFFPLSPSGPRTFVRLFYRASSHVLSRSRRAGRGLRLDTDFFTAKAPLCDRSATYRGLQGRGLSLDPLPHPRYFCEKSAQGYEGRAVDSSGSAKE